MSRLVVGDTSPINYLIRIDHIDVLPKLFDKVVLPEAVLRELCDVGAPGEVRDWIAHPPSWVEVHPELPSTDEALATLDAGEAAAIALATELQADLVMMDDRDGVAVARLRGLKVTGTLGVLVRADGQRLLDLSDAFERLRRAGFHCTEELYGRLLADAETGRSR